MSKLLQRPYAKQYLLIIAILILTDIAVVLNIPFLRQILGFLYFTIIPGLLILQILKLNDLTFLEKFVFSWGLSISFLMFFGLLLNSLLPSFGYLTPLSATPLLIAFNIAFIILAIAGYKLNKSALFSLPNLNLSTSEKAFLIIPLALPLLSILGTRLMNTTDNNMLLMLLLFLIPIYVISVCFLSQKFPRRIYPVVIFLISISLLLLLSLRSNHLIGSDIYSEFSLYQTTLSNSHWSISGYSTLDACLSISLLPTIYQCITNVDPEFLFKILYSVVFSISPLVVYILSKKYLGELCAFLASVFFMAQNIFLWTTANARTSIAVLFFALTMVTLFNDKMNLLQKRALFIVFIASSIVSHYTTSYIFFFIVLVAFVGVKVLSRIYPFKHLISLLTVLIFFAVIFLWYSQIMEVPFSAGIKAIQVAFTNLSNIFILELKRESSQAILATGFTGGIPYMVHFVCRWLTFSFIGIGIIASLIKYKGTMLLKPSFKKIGFLKEKFEVEYFVVALACTGLLITSVVLPAMPYGLDRVYTIGIIILSAFFVIGGVVLSKYLKVRSYVVVLMVLVPFFLSTTGIIYQVTGYTRSVILNSTGEQADWVYIHDQDVSSAKWLIGYGATNKKEPGNLRIYSDHFGGGPVKLASDVNQHSSIDLATSFFKDNKTIDEGYIYLRYANVVAGKVYLGGYEYAPITEYSHLFAGKNKIYSNGGCEVWK